MADQLTPYVNSSKLSNHLNQTVRIVGKLLKSHDNTAIIESSDGGQIQVTMNRESNYSTSYLEIIGKVTSDLSMVEFVNVPLGNDLDLKSIDMVIEAMSRHRDIFG